MKTAQGIRHCGSLLVAVLVLGMFMSCAEERELPSQVAEARESYAAGHFSDAEALYEEYLQTYPEGPQRWEAWNRLLDVALNVRGDYESGEALLEAMYLEFGMDPEIAFDLLSRLAGVYESMGDMDRAVQTWQECLKIEGLDIAHHPDVFMQLAKIFQLMRDYDLAVEALQACSDVTGDLAVKANCEYEMAQTLGYMQNWHRAKGVLDTVLEYEELDPELLALATFMLADIHEHEGDYSTARELLESIRDTYPNPRVVETRLEHLDDLRD